MANFCHVLSKSISNFNSALTNEAAFMNMLRLANSGLELYKSTDGKHQKWGKIELTDEEGNVTVNNCDE